MPDLFPGGVLARQREHVHVLGSDRVAVARALHGLKIRAAKQPGALMDVAIDDHGDLDRASFIVQVKDGKQEVKEVLPPVTRF